MLYVWLISWVIIGVLISTKTKSKINIIGGGFIASLIVFCIFAEITDQKKSQQPKIEIQKQKAVHSLTIQFDSWKKCKFSKACWKVYVSNQSDTAIKDIHFKMYYYAKSGTVISTGEETIYEVMNGGEERWFEFDEYLRDQVVSAKVVIDNAKWMDEEGEVYLDW